MPDFVGVTTWLVAVRSMLIDAHGVILTEQMFCLTGHLFGFHNDRFL
jgi:hypothetical protein